MIGHVGIYGGQIDVIYTDFEKAFGGVPRNKLISYSMVITSMEISLNGLTIKTYLRNRLQRVKINSCF